MGKHVPNSVNIDSLKGLVFVRSKDQEYGPIRILWSSPGTHPAAACDQIPIAEDSCGNAFVLTSDGKVIFWDHETNDLTELADNWDSFVVGCKPPTPVDFDPSKVKSAWINPAFAKMLRDKEK